jgi:hypothetical protein
MIIDLRQLNNSCSDYNITCATLKHLHHLSRPNDYFVSLELADGYYTLGIRETYRDFLEMEIEWLHR